MKIDEAKIAVYKIQGLPMSEKKHILEKKCALNFSRASKINARTVKAFDP